jgi:hypothetical protein
MRRLHFWAAGTAGLSLVMGCGDSGTTGTGGSTSSSHSSSSHAASVTIASSGSGQNAGIGATCETDADCGGSLTCLKSADDVAIFAGGPGNGYCSTTCSSDTDCPNGMCFGQNADKRCVETCTVGDPALMYLDSPLDETKCHGREDVRCQTVSSADICVPTCRSDADCGSRHCDPLNAVCVDMPHTGDPNGSVCDPMNSQCAGTCVSFTGGETMCSNVCTLGGVDLDAECGGLAGGLCVFSPMGHALGDQAFCTPSCLKQDDCQNPTFWCQSIGGITGMQVPNGFCFGTSDCPNGQADCTNMMLTCTPTKYGPKCLDPAFPLGTAGGGGAGGGGGGGGGGAGGTGGAGGATSTGTAGGGGASSSSTGP